MRGCCHEFSLTGADHPCSNPHTFRVIRLACFIKAIPCFYLPPCLQPYLIGTSRRVCGRGFIKGQNPCVSEGLQCDFISPLQGMWRWQRWHRQSLCREWLARWCWFMCYCFRNRKWWKWKKNGCSNVHTSTFFRPRVIDRSLAHLPTNSPLILNS